jgi:hypothetical protein
VAGRANEFPELVICDGVPVDPEIADGDAMDRGFFRIVFVGSHAEGAAGNRDHAREANAGGGVGQICYWYVNTRHFGSGPTTDEIQNQAAP